MIFIAFRRRIPTERSTELAGGQRRDERLFFQAINTCWVDFHFPRSRIVVPVGADRLWHIVMIQLADPRREISGLAKRLWQADMRRDRLSKDLCILQDARAVRVKSR